MTAIVHALNVGTPEPAPYAATGRSSIRKESRPGPLRIHRLGLEGDEVTDLRYHGGPDKAVYAFAREDLDHWAEVLGRPVPDGQFGENITTRGIDVNEALMGERWRVGTALVEVSEPRIPCNDFKGWMGVSGFDKSAWVKRFTAQGRPGPYLRVIEEGVVSVGDPVVVEYRPTHGVSLSAYFRASTTEKTNLAAVKAAIAAAG